MGGAIKITCVLHEKIANLTALTVAKNELHYFIPNDSDLTNNLELFVYIYSLRKDWHQEHWILDVSDLKFFVYLKISFDFFLPDFVVILRFSTIILLIGIVWRLFEGF